jgi:predicted AlkP superfamily phosphohydrolase/phosphomutase
VTQPTVRSRVFCLGLDGGTFTLLEPWARDGALPNIGRMMAEGTRAPLESVILPFSPQAWGSFMTGVNPGRHGVFGFKRKVPDGYAFRLVNNKDLKSETLWALLSDLGRKVIVVNVPTTYPPESVNGVLVSGMDAPGLESAFVHPPTLKDELLRVVPEYVIHLHIGDGYLDSDVKRRNAVKGLVEMVDGRAKLVLHLLKNYDWDLFVVNFAAIDQVQHHFWQSMNTAGEFRDAIRTVYQRVDEVLGEITAGLPPDTTRFVLSDHGAGPVSSHVFFVDEWLREQGFLAFKRRALAASLFRRFVLSLLGLASRRLPSHVKDTLMRRFPQLRARSQGFIRRSLTDWFATQVYSGEHPATLRINLKGRDRYGTVDPEKYEALRETLIERLAALKHPQTGEPFIDRVYRREELYRGPYVEMAPDLIIFPKDFAHQVRGGPFPPGFRHRRAIAEKEGRRFFLQGTHRVDGVFVAHGPGIRRGHSVGPLHITDLFPTILYALGAAIPQNLDGRLMTDIFAPEFLATHPPEYVHRDLDRDSSATGSGTYTDEETKQIESSLRSLGYIE